MAGTTTTSRALGSLLLLWGAVQGCMSTSGDGAGSIIVGIIGNPDPNQRLDHAALSLNDDDIFAVTDRFGNFGIPGVPEGTYNLRLTKWGIPLVTRVIDLAPGQTTLDLTRTTAQASEGTVVTVQWPQLPTGPELLRGVVLDADDAPIDNAELFLVYPSLDDAFSRTVTALGTLEDGRFEFTEVPAGDNRTLLVVGKDGYRPVVLANPFGGRDPEFVLTEPIVLERLPGFEAPDLPTLEVQVRSAAGALLPNLTVYLTASQAEFRPVDRYGIGVDTSDEGMAEFGALPPGPYVLWAGSRDYLPTTVPITLASGESRTVTITLTAKNHTENPFLAQP